MQPTSGDVVVELNYPRPTQQIATKLEAMQMLVLTVLLRPHGEDCVEFIDFLDLPLCLAQSPLHHEETLLFYSHSNPHY